VTHVEKLIAIALGGAAGALLRTSACSLTERHLGPGFSFGTPLVNVAGSFLIGLIAGAGAQMNLSPPARDALVVGGLGAFTTFSAFSLDTLTLASSAGLPHAIGNIAANFGLALAATPGGVLRGRALAT
jgi:CrcB protein